MTDASDVVEKLKQLSGDRGKKAILKIKYDRNNVKQIRALLESAKEDAEEKYFKEIQNNFNAFSLCPFFTAFSSLSKTTLKIFVSRDKP